MNSWIVENLNSWIHLWSLTLMREMIGVRLEEEGKIVVGLVDFSSMSESDLVFACAKVFDEEDSFDFD